MIGEEETPGYNPFDNAKDKKQVGKNSFDPFKIKESAYIDLDKTISHPPTAISIGTYSYRGNEYPKPFGSYGDISCIVGPSKSKKTFFKSAVIAAYIGGNSINYFGNMVGHESVGKYVIDIDTEQSRFHSQRTFKRVQEMTGIKHELYKGFSLREYTPPERIEFIEWLLNESEYSGNIGLVSIDGYADLVTDFNNIDQASELSNKLMKWSSEQNCHVTGVLHRNFGTQKPVGHVGSFILKKAETVVFVESDQETGFAKVTCEYSRNIPFEDIDFGIDKEHLPYRITDVVEKITNNAAPF